jgi:hypothetical protein
MASYVFLLGIKLSVECARSYYHFMSAKSDMLFKHFMDTKDSWSNATHGLGLLSL